jgi:hypothetical protein
MTWMIASLIGALVFAAGALLIRKDRDLEITLTKKEWFLCLLAEAFSFFFCFRMDVAAGFYGGGIIFSAVVMAYLVINAITDKRAHLVYCIFPVFFAIAAILIIMAEQGNGNNVPRYLLETFVLLAFPDLLYRLRLYAKGDPALVFMPGITYYVLYKDAVQAVICECIVLFFAELLMLIHAIGTGNLKKGVLKKGMPLGPYLLISYIGCGTAAVVLSKYGLV